MYRVLLVLFAVGILSWPSIAPAQLPSAEDQAAILRNLSDEDREAMLQQMRRQGASEERPVDGAPDDGQPPDRGDLTETETDDAAGAAQAQRQKPIIKAGDSIVIELELPSPQTVPGATQPPNPRNPANQPAKVFTEEETLAFRKLQDRVRARNPYRLTRDGALLLPGFEAVPLAGLTEQQATLRLRVMPALREFEIKVTLLPLTQFGVEALQPFGYELFNQKVPNFAPVTNVPLPADYVMGPGDQLEVQLYGNQNRTLRLVVGRDGRISFPELGPINVGGHTFNGVKANIESRVAQRMIGVRASVSMGNARAIRVFVLGDANRPGSYTISGLGTITSALYAAGGVKPIGSLRKVELKRAGAVVRRYDLYDLLIRGDTSDDANLLPGDVVFVPPIGPTVSVDGEVRRPAIYELNGEASVPEILQLAGGLTPDADSASAALTRIDGRQRVVLPVDLSDAQVARQGMRNGDLLRIPRLKPTLDGGVSIEGHVHAPGAYSFQEGMWLTDALRSVQDLKPNADLHYVLIRRELMPDRQIQVLSADLAAALAAPRSEADLLLNPRDRILVFDLESGRDQVIRPLLDEVRLQSNYTHPTGVVRIDGRVKVRGEYPL
jgi:polysaccharide biosynthesis/export protein